MFGRKKSNRSFDLTRLSSLVAEHMTITGDVSFSGGLRVDGRIRGMVASEDDTNGLLVLSDKGTIIGAVKVHNAVINGTIEGDLEVSQFLELQANARVTGNISYRQLQLECGATVDGKLVRLDDEGKPVARETDSIATPATAPRYPVVGTATG
jgi:cytoskeletal protein CcmA (bactofilin family)